MIDIPSVATVLAMTKVVFRVKIEVFIIVLDKINPFNFLGLNGFV